LIPIDALLARIRWDPTFGHGEFAVGYWDRIRRSLIVVPLAALRFGEDGAEGFEVVDDSGQVCSVPLHRIRQVLRDGQVIWERHPASDRPE